MSCRSGGGYCKARREEVWIDKDTMIQRSALNRGGGSASVARERGKRVGGHIRVIWQLFFLLRKFKF